MQIEHGIYAILTVVPDRNKVTLASGVLGQAEAAEQTPVARDYMTANQKQLDTYQAANRECARIIAADLDRYPGLMQEWAALVLGRRRRPRSTRPRPGRGSHSHKSAGLLLRALLPGVQSSAGTTTEAGSVKTWRRLR